MIEQVPDEEFPPVSKRFVEALESRIPAPRPQPGGTERGDLYHSGQYSVVELLWRIFRLQNETQED